MNNEKPIVAVTMGDPAGIGPEIVCKALPKSDDVHYLIIGDIDVMKKASKIAQTDWNFRSITDISQVASCGSTIDVFTPEGVNVGDFEFGVVDERLGKAAGLCIRQMALWAKDGVIQGMVSAPLNKDAFHRAGFDYRDEMMFMGELTGSPEPFIGGAVNNLWTITIAEHVPFKEILGLVTKDRVLARIRLLNDNLKRAGIVAPKIAVAALNCHAGDGGLFGTEEITEINPAIEIAKSEGIDVIGSIAADSIFINAFDGRYDGIVCMYHDQANIARKLQPRENGCTLFLGLPVMCATTAHGTAFEIAGQGKANAGGIATAIRWVSKFAENSK